MTAALAPTVVTATTVVTRVEQLDGQQRAQLAAAWQAHHARYGPAQTAVAWRVVRDGGARLAGVQRERAEAWLALCQVDEGCAWAAADVLLVELAGDLMSAAERALFAWPWLAVVADDLIGAVTAVPRQRVCPALAGAEHLLLNTP